MLVYLICGSFLWIEKEHLVVAYTCYGCVQVSRHGAQSYNILACHPLPLKVLCGGKAMLGTLISMQTSLNTGRDNPPPPKHSAGIVNTLKWAKVD